MEYLTNLNKHDPILHFCLHLIFWTFFMPRFKKELQIFVLQCRQLICLHCVYTMFTLNFALTWDRLKPQFLVLPTQTVYFFFPRRVLYNKIRYLYLPVN